MLIPLLRLLSRLPLSLLYVIADLIAWWAQYVSRYRYEVIKQNLTRSFPEKTEGEINKIIQGCYRNLADLVVETLKAITISEEELRRRVTFKNIDLLQERLNKQESVILIAIHQCNWEWMLLAGCLELPYRVDALYLPLRNKTMDELMLRTRSRFGGKPISAHQALMEVMKRKKEMRAFGMLADQVPPKASDKYWSQFLNQDTAFLLGTEQLPKVTRSAAIFMNIERVKRGYYEVSLEMIAEPPYARDENHPIIETYKVMAEKLIRKNPSDWLWSHRRWKYKKPVYAG
jgi:KDO2-lipid IV(A) lauroyltransferase